MSLEGSSEGRSDAPADWYADPEKPGALRYWDGGAWTEHRHPAARSVGQGKALPPAGWYPDPERAGSLRYWDGRLWTGQRHPPETAEVLERARDRRSTRDARQRQVSTQYADRRAAFSVIHTITLGKFFSKKWQQHFAIPELVAEIRRDPANPVPHVWLGLRLRAMEHAKRQLMPIERWNPAARTARKVSRAVVQNVTKTRAVDGFVPASTRALENAFMVALRAVQLRPRNAPALDVLARVYLAQGLLAKAEEFARLSLKADSSYLVASYTLTEARWSLGKRREARVTAQWALEQGFTLPIALMGRVRKKKKKVDHAYAVSLYWQRQIKYFKGATPEDYEAYFGPSPILNYRSRRLRGLR